MGKNLKMFQNNLQPTVLPCRKYSVSRGCSKQLSKSGRSSKFTAGHKMLKGVSKNLKCLHETNNRLLQMLAWKCITVQSERYSTIYFSIFAVYKGKLFTKKLARGNLKTRTSEIICFRQKSSHLNAKIKNCHNNCEAWDYSHYRLGMFSRSRTWPALHHRALHEFFDVLDAAWEINWIVCKNIKVELKLEQ